MLLRAGRSALPKYREITSFGIWLSVDSHGASVDRSSGIGALSLLPYLDGCLSILVDVTCLSGDNLGLAGTAMLDINHMTRCQSGKLSSEDLPVVVLVTSVV